MDRNKLLVRVVIVLLAALALIEGLSLAHVATTPTGVSPPAANTAR